MNSVWDSVKLHDPCAGHCDKNPVKDFIHFSACIAYFATLNKWSVKQRLRPTCVVWYLAIADLLESLLVGFAIVVNLGLCS